MNVFLMDTFKDGENITRRKTSSVLSKKKWKYFLKKIFKYLGSISKQGNVQVLGKWILNFYFVS